MKKNKRKRIIPHGWKEIKISDVFETSSGSTPTASKQEYYENGDIPWINSGELTKPYIYRTNNFITKEGYDNSSTKMYPIDTVLVAMYGATAGKASILKMEACTNQAVCAILPNPDYDPLFIKYSIDTLYDYLVGLSTGSARDNLSQAGIKDLKLIVPNSLKEQKQLASVLATLDKKITLNRQINDNLEAMARQLYDYWFVQFDFPDENGRPYKSNGGKMVWNEKLKLNIPMGWIVEDISKIADVFNGATPSTKEERNYGGNIVWITPKDLSDQQSKFVYYGERNITQKGYDSCSTHMLPVGTVLMSSRAPIGLLSIAKSELCTNQGFKSFVPKKETLGSYLYYYIRLHIKQIEQLGAGTTFKEVSRDDVMTYPILVPKEELLNKWSEFIFPIDNRQFEIQQENNNLTKQRDELLPLLMNGQATVNYHLSDD